MMQLVAWHQNQLQLHKQSASVCLSRGICNFFLLAVLSVHFHRSDLLAFLDTTAMSAKLSKPTLYHIEIFVWVMWLTKDLPLVLLAAVMLWMSRHQSEHWTAVRNNKCWLLNNWTHFNDLKWDWKMLYYSVVKTLQLCHSDKGCEHTEGWFYGIITNFAIKITCGWPCGQFSRKIHFHLGLKVLIKSANSRLGLQSYQRPRILSGAYGTAEPTLL